MLRRVLLCRLLLHRVLLLLAVTSAAHAEDRPNILFVFSDDHAPHAIGAHGGWLSAVDTTPNLDRLARQGMLFRRSFCTNSICGPIRAVILTGKHSHHWEVPAEWQARFRGGR